jgi:TolB protein
VTTRRVLAGEPRPIAARLAVVDGQGHPAIPDTGGPRFDSQNGLVYFFSDGVSTIELPAGDAKVLAAHGLAAPTVERTVAVGAGGGATTLDLEPLWDASAAGWHSGDHHWHLNYGGPYSLRPEDVLTELHAEALDVATPQVANLHTRFMDLELWDWRRRGEGPPLVEFAQEVRSHFLGHLGLVGTATPYWPWYWGPGYPVYGGDDRENADALGHARREGGFGMYVHPVRPQDPFPKAAPPDGIPLELVPDAVLGDLDGLEVACLWSDEIGTSELWYRLLNLGLPIAPSGGTDAMPNFFRMMAVGTTRVYVRTDGPLTFERYLHGLKAGRSFVTNGPLPRFTVGSAAQPGDTVVAATTHPFTLTVSSAIAFERVEVLVNGRVAWSESGLAAAGTKTWTGTVRAPAAGWLAARTVGGETRWPAMDSYPFAHTAPIWIGTKGSRDASAAQDAARDLLRWLDVAEKRLVDGYGTAPIPRLRARFTAARRRLEALAGK